MAVYHRSGRETPLFSAFLAPPEGEAIVSGDGDVRLYRAWLARDRADALIADIRATTLWTQERRKMYDRFVDVPREQAWFGDDRERPFTTLLDAVRRELETMLATPFAYVLLNRYRDGRDSVAWHNDAIVSIDVDHGDLIVMRGDTQTNYDHRVRKDSRVTSERINLTFRQQPE